MRDDARVRPPNALARALVWWALVAATVSCSGAEHRRRRHTDDGWDGPPAKSAAPPRRPFPGLEALTSMPAVGQLRTVHPIGDLEATLRTNEAGAGYGKRGRGPMPEGAIVVESLSAEPGSIALTHYIMRKREPGFFAAGGDWEYAVVDRDGSVQAEGKLTLCARCHAEAPRDHLFEPLGPP